MIAHDEIKRQAVKWWPAVLRSVITKENFFPKEISRIGKIQPGDITTRYEALRTEVDELYKYSKNQTGIGYFVQTVDKTFRRAGHQELPDSVVFESLEDYLHVSGKAKEWTAFQQNLSLIDQRLPQLRDWIFNNLLELTSTRDWNGILDVCEYFISNPRPALYLRQLPIRVHTKFIEEQTGLILSLLDYLIPGHIKNADQKRISERFYLKYEEPLIRIRILDAEERALQTFHDISIPLSDFESKVWSTETVYITENRMNFLTLPDAPSTIAIWSGGGFQVSYLKNVKWLQNKKIYYWGDIDEHGFQILNQIRSYYQQAESLMMDQQTFQLFREFCVTGKKNSIEHFNRLNENEAELYALLKSRTTKNRLEQEKIPQWYVDDIFRSLLSTPSDLEDHLVVKE